MVLMLDEVKYRRPQVIGEVANMIVGSVRLHGCYLFIGLDEY